MKCLTPWIVLSSSLVVACGGDSVAPATDAATSQPDSAAPDAATRSEPPSMVTVLAAGVDVPWFVGVGAGGAADPVRLGPRRGGGYQQAAGTVSYPQLTPDGSTVVVVYQEVGGDPVLYALPADGTGAEAPIRVADAPGLSALDRSYADGLVAFVADGGLYAAALDGTDPAPRLLAGGHIEHPMWVTGTSQVAYLVVDSPGGSRVWTVADGDPVDLSTGGTTLEWVVAPLPGGRVLARGADDRLYAVPAEGGTAVPLTPPGRPTTFEGMAGGRVVVELRTPGSDLRELVSVTTDGALAVLTPEPSTTLDVAVQRDGDRVAWSAKGAGEKWAAFEGPAGGPGSQITGWNGKRIRVTSYAGDVVAGATEEGRVLRFFLPGGPNAKSQVVHDVGPIVNMSYPWPVVSAGATHLLYQANTPDGWRSWVLPAAGGAPTVVDGAWTWDLVTPFGIVTREAVALGAAAATSPTAEPHLLTQWHEAPLIQPRSVGGWIVYGCEAPTPGWYAVPSEGGGPEAPALGNASGVWEPPALIAGALARVVGTTLEGVTLDAAGHGAPRTLLNGVTGRPLPLPDAGVVVAPQGGRVVSQPVLGGEPILVLDAGAPVQGLYPMPDGERVLALSVQDSSYTPQLHVARIDGTEAGAPLEVGALGGWVLSVTPTPDGQRVLAEVSIEATAVPHPDALVSASIGADPPEAVVIAKLPVGRWGSPPPGGSFDIAQGSPLVVTADARVILQGPNGLLSAPTDGSAEPVSLGPATGFVGVALTHHGVVASEEGSLTLADPAVAGSQRVIAAGLPTPLGDGLLAGDRLVLRAGSGALLVALDTGTVTPLVEADVDALLSLTPDGEAALMTLGARLALVPLSPTPTPALVARPGDATDAFVGWLP